MEVQKGVETHEVEVEVVTLAEDEAFKVEGRLPRCNVGCRCYEGGKG